MKVYGREKQQENTDYILIFLFVSPRDQPLLQQFYSMWKYIIIRMNDFKKCITHQAACQLFWANKRPGSKVVVWFGDDGGGSREEEFIHSFFEWMTM